MLISPEIKTINEKKLVGHSLKMSLVNNKTFELFSGFMPHRVHIKNTVSDCILEVLEYDDLYFENFNPNNTFQKWATVEVSKFEDIPQGMKTFTLKKCLYAVFKYVGTSKGFGVFMSTVYTQWLPQSKYTLNNTLHFNELNTRYKPNDSNAEELVYLPIKLKGIG
ncbi:GyrI-like domain-containing protein [Lacinutrix salivirga]